MDGGSKDETASIVRNHPLQPTFISETDRGQSHAVNKGLAKAKGQHIAWINSDDYFHPKAFFFLREYLLKHKDTKVVYGDGDIVDENGRYICPYPTEDWNHDRLADKCFLCQPSVIFHRDVFETVGMLDENLHLALDLEYWMRAGQAFSFTRLPIKVACSRHYEGTKSNTRPLQMQLEALLVGHRHIGRWSSRRLWSVTENRLIINKPKLAPEALDTNRDHFLFWLYKITGYLRLRTRLSLTNYLERLLKESPSR